MKKGEYEEEYPRTYRYNLGWRIFVTIGGPLLIALFVYLSSLLLKVFLTSDGEGWPIYLLLIVVEILMITMISLLLGGILEFNLGRLTIYKNKIAIKKFFSTRECFLKDIKGYTVTKMSSENHSYMLYTLIPKDKKQKKIKITDYFSRFYEIEEFITSNLKNLTKAAEASDKRKALADIRLGKSLDERRAFIQRKSKIIGYLAIASIILFLWTAFYPRPYEILLSTLIALPLISILIVYIGRGAVRYDEVEGQWRPSTASIFILPLFALALRALYDFQILNINKLIVMILFSSLILTLLVFFSGREEFTTTKIKAIFAILLIFVFSALYSYGSIVTINSMFDFSEPESNKALVIEKYIDEDDDGDEYNLILGPWSTKEANNTIKVPQYLYECVNVGEEIDIYTKPGILGLQWYYPNYWFCDEKIAQ